MQREKCEEGDFPGAGISLPGNRRGGRGDSDSSDDAVPIAGFCTVCKEFQTVSLLVFIHKAVSKTFGKICDIARYDHADQA